jgi:hypothetical protein
MATAAIGTSSNGLNYVGNNDYRGYLSYQAQQGDKNAATLLNFVGNDGNFSNGSQFMAPLSSDINNANSTYYKNWTGAGTTTNKTTAPDTSVADNISALDDADTQLNGQLGSVHTNLDNGLTQLNDDYNKTVNRTNEDEATALKGYDDNRVTTTKARLGATDAINQNSNTLANSVRRIIGLASGNNSTAYNITAPGLIAKDADAKLTENADTFAANFKKIDDAQNDTKTRFDRAITDYGDTKKAKESALRQGILEQEQSIYGDLANNAAKRTQLNGGTYADGKAAAASATANVNSRQSAIDALFSQFRTPYAMATVTPTAATTGDYNATKTNLNQPTAGDGSAVSESPYLQFLKKQFQGATA